jgi:hypothetical protein
VAGASDQSEFVQLPLGGVQMLRCLGSFLSERVLACGQGAGLLHESGALAATG